jgi:hypothetical protein
MKDSGPRPCAARALLWLALLSLNALMVATVIVAAHSFRRPALYLTATGPLLLVGLFALLIWWDTRRPRRASVLRVLGWATVVADALLLAHATAAVHLAGRFALFLMIGPLVLAALLTFSVGRYIRRSLVAAARNTAGSGGE